MVQKRKTRRGEPANIQSNCQPPADFPPPFEQSDAPHGEQDDGNDPEGDDPDGDPDDDQFDPNAVDFLGDFGLDDDEAIPDHNDFWFDDLDPSFD